MRIEVSTQDATYRLLDGPPQKVLHHGEEIFLTEDEAITRDIPKIPIKVGPRPTQPPGRAPASREARKKAKSR